MSKDKEPEVIKIEEVSAILGPPRAIIYHLIRTDPDFPKPFKPGKRLFWIRSEVIAYREKKQAEYAERNPVPTKPDRPPTETERWEIKRQRALDRQVADAFKKKMKDPK